MKLVVGLGNPGQKYTLNRHNVGFMVLDAYVKNADLFFSKNKDSLIAIDNIKKVIFLKPQTYMNNSGLEVKRIADYYKINPENILVIQDDKDIEFSKLKLKINSSSGGHNGIKNIIGYCGDAFLRLKIGIKTDEVVNVKEFVLENFSSTEAAFLNNNMGKYFLIIQDFINHENSYVINRHNGVQSDI